MTFTTLVNFYEFFFCNTKVAEFGEILMYLSVYCTSEESWEERGERECIDDMHVPLILEYVQCH